MRFPIAALFIIILSVTSVVISLTGPREPLSLEPAISQENLSTSEQLLAIDSETSGRNDPYGQEEIQDESPKVAHIEKEQPTLEMLTPNRTNNDLSPERIVSSVSFVPNFVAQGEEAKLSSSFTPIQIADSPTTPPTSPPSSPVPPESSPDEPSTPDVNDTFIPNVERWRDDVVAAIAAYGGPASDVDLFLTIMHRESRGQPDATNPTSGAAGLMQHMPQYWDQRAISAGYSGASPYDPVANINVSAWLLYQAAGGGWGHWSTY